MKIKESLNSFIVCGHRGYAGKYPENTMSAFIAAAELGVDMIEVDVVASKDGVPVICHDYDLDRTSDGHGLLADYTLAELQKFNMAAKSALAVHPEQICTFEEICVLVQKYPELMINIDMKDDDGTIANKVADIVERFGYQERVVFNGLNGKGLAAMYDRGYFVEASPDGFYTMQHFNALFSTDTKKAQALCLNANQHINREIVEKLRGYGVEVWAWCSSWDERSQCDDGTWKEVDCQSCMQNMVDHGITMALCNHPDRCIKFLKDRGLR